VDCELLKITVNVTSFDGWGAKEPLDEIFETLAIVRIRAGGPTKKPA
jgi:hypothetical protein